MTPFVSYVVSELWMEITMFGLAMIFYVHMSGGFSPVKVKRKVVADVSPPESPQQSPRVTNSSPTTTDDEDAPRWTWQALTEQEIAQRRALQAKPKPIIKQQKKLPQRQKQQQPKQQQVEAVQPQTSTVTVAATSEEVSLAAIQPYEPVNFRRELSTVLHELSMDHNSGKAVKRIRAQQVPAEHQAKEFADMLTRCVEEHRGPARFSFFAFAAGLAKGDPNGFAREECLQGVCDFFDDVYEDLCAEIPKLPRIVTQEMLPTFYSVLPAEHLDPFVPEAILASMRHAS